MAYRDGQSHLCHSPKDIKKGDSWVPTVGIDSRLGISSFEDGRFFLEFFFWNLGIPLNLGFPLAFFLFWALLLEPIFIQKNKSENINVTGVLEEKWRAIWN